MMLETYRKHLAEREAMGIPPLPLDADQTAELITLLKKPETQETPYLLELLTHRVPPGVDNAAKVKASFLAAVAHGDISVAALSPSESIEIESSCKQRRDASTHCLTWPTS